MKWWNNGQINKRSEECPGLDFVKGRLKFKRASPTPETRMKMSIANSGRPSKLKGVLRGPDSIITRIKKSQSAHKRDNSVYKGKIPWCKGLDVSDPRIAKIRDVQLGQRRTGKYVKGENHPQYNPNRNEFLRYKTKVQRLTEQTYAKFINDINPHFYPRALAGVEGGYHLDHIKSIWVGYQENVSPEEIAKKENLQMLPWLDNIKKNKN
jgi:hypothetical protein